MAMTLKPNLSKADRFFRGVIGAFMLLDSARRPQKVSWSFMEALVGSAFLLHGVTGFDPLLKKLSLSTLPHSGNNLFSRLKQAIPGQGINPLLTQQPVPGKDLRSKTLGQTFREISAIQ